MKLPDAILTSGNRLAGREASYLAIRMFRGPQILAWSCPIRPLLIVRESHLSALSEFTGPARDLKERRYERVCDSKEGSETVSPPVQQPLCSLNCETHQLTKASFKNLLSNAILSSAHHPSKFPVSVNAKPVSDSLKCTFVKDLDKNVKAVSSYPDCLVNTTCLRPRGRPWDICQPSLLLTNRSQCKLPHSNLYYRHHLVRPLSSCTRTQWILNHSHNGPHPSVLKFDQDRALHQAAPHEADPWKYCLSLENERRCRQRLAPNLSLYDPDKIKIGQSQSKGKNQERWAAVLVSLCSVDGEPAFLFTLRSSMLKGRHKGDVSFAGGKSDPSDRDVVDTALREAREELGVTVPTERVWGTLKPLRDRSGMIIAPVLANLGPLEDLSFKPNPGEVEDIFTMSLSHLCNPQNRGYTNFRTGDKYGYTLPVFRNGKYRVWGLTAMALDYTLKLVVPR
ncbi:nucleoside diphosphate-linked moiety X motif 8 [Labrus bergylta]|uniref:Nudix hydrolase 8 n=1 Tax=Labrus bergylta TaxID=56723 RepID=A0A3Q3M592_9LABR|nr:nucleoside diphosphate-linked moiety X motif 8 isoform X1 [Labrus bergylta]